MIEANFSVQRDNFRLDINFSIPSVGVTALFGPSGSGKTTTINALAGITKPSSGYISIDEKRLFDRKARVDIPIEKRGLGYVFQDGRLFPHLTVEENLTYGMPKTEIVSSRKFEIFNLLGLEALLNRKPISLSGGERQRTAIGRALLSSPRLLLMDEPLAGLDFARKQELLPYLTKLKKSLKLPIIYVSHQLDEVLRLADNLILLNNGKIIRQGPIEEIVNSREIQSLLGRDEKITFLTCTASPSVSPGGLGKLTFDGGHLWTSAVNFSKADNLRVQLRAQDIAIALKKPDNISIANVLDATVYSIKTSIGPHTDIELTLGNTRIWSRVTNQSATNLNLKKGSKVYALIKSTAIQPF